VQKLFLNTMQKNSSENSVPLTRNYKKNENISLGMTSMTMLTWNQNPSNLIVSKKSKLKSTKFCLFQNPSNFKIDLIRTKLDGLCLWVNMAIDVITKWNLFGFYDFSVTIRNFQAKFFALRSEKFFKVLIIKFLPVIVLL